MVMSILQPVIRNIAAIMKKFFGKDSVINVLMYHRTLHEEVNNNNSVNNNTLFTVNEVNEVLKNFKINKTPGADIITYIVFINVPLLHFFLSFQNLF